MAKKQNKQGNMGIIILTAVFVLAVVFGTRYLWQVWEENRLNNLPEVYLTEQAKNNFILSGYNAQWQPFAQKGGPCEGLLKNRCVLDTHDIWQIGNTLWLSVSRNGKEWIYRSALNPDGTQELNGWQLVLSKNIADYDILREAGGPCEGLSGNQCKMTTHDTWVIGNVVWLSITRNGKEWYYKAQTTEEDNKGPWQLVTAKILADYDLLRAANGPCAGLQGSDCKLNTHNTWVIQDKVWLSVTRNGKEWIYKAQTNPDGTKGPWELQVSKNIADWEQLKGPGGPCENEKNTSCYMKTHKIWTQNNTLHLGITKDGSTWLWTSDIGPNGEWNWKPQQIYNRG